MRKTKITIAICLVLVLCGLISGLGFLYSGKKLDHTWTTLYGDISAAAGLEIDGTCEVASTITSNYTKIWDYSYSVTSTGVDTKDKYCHSIRKSDFSWLDSFNIMAPRVLSPYCGLSAEAEYCYKMLQEANAADSSVTSIKIYLDEIFEYTPLYGEIVIGDYSSKLGDYYSWLRDEYLKDYNDFSEFFKIPVNAGGYIVISENSIRKPGEDNQEGYAFNNVVSNRDYFNADKLLTGLYTPNYIFIYFNDDADRVWDIDKSLIPGGNGIYRLPYEYHNSSNSEKPKTNLHTEELTNILPLDENAYVCDVVYREEEDRLYVFTEENKAGYLYVMNATSGQLIQKTLIADDWDGDYSILYRKITFGDDYCLISSVNCRIIVLTEDEKGIYTKEIDFKVEGEFWDKYYDTFFRAVLSMSFAYKDGKVAMLCMEEEKVYDSFRGEEGNYAFGVNLALAVFEDGKPSYVGVIENSLCDAINNAHIYNYYYENSSGDKLVMDEPSVKYTLSWK